MNSAEFKALEEKYQRAKDLMWMISDIPEEIDLWENKFTEASHILGFEKDSYIPDDTFQSMRVIAIDALKKKLESHKQEFDEL